LSFAAAISIGVASYFYSTAFDAFVTQKVNENVTALQLVDAP
jgi:hypothetical protein